MSERTILVPVDGSARAIEGLDHACREYPDADIVALHVVSFGRLFGDRALLSFEDVEGWLDDEHERATDILDEAAGRAEELGQELTSEVQLGRPSSVIVAYAEERDVDHIVMGSRGAGDGSGAPLGSVAESVMRDAPVLVTVVR
jgi:nucleotide-binding universal stress UspA family protein